MVVGELPARAQRKVPVEAQGVSGGLGETHKDLFIEKKFYRKLSNVRVLNSMREVLVEKGLCSCQLKVTALDTAARSRREEGRLHSSRGPYGRTVQYPVPGYIFISGKGGQETERFSALCSLLSEVYPV